MIRGVWGAESAAGLLGVFLRLVCYVLPVDFFILVYKPPIPTLKIPYFSQVYHDSRFRCDFIITKDSSVSLHSIATFPMLPVNPKVPETIFSSHKEKGKLKKEVKKQFLLPKASEKREW